MMTVLYDVAPWVYRAEQLAVWVFIESKGNCRGCLHEVVVAQQDSEAGSTPVLRAVYLNRCPIANGSTIPNRSQCPCDSSRIADAPDPSSPKSPIELSEPLDEESLGDGHGDGEAESNMLRSGFKMLIHYFDPCEPCSGGGSGTLRSATTSSRLMTVMMTATGRSS